MIAPIETSSADHRTEFVQDQFLIMLPRIRRQAWRAFRRWPAEAREELIQEVIANAYCSWVRLVKQGRAEVAFPTPLAQFAIRQVRAGRRVGSRQHAQDILSPCAGRGHDITINRLGQRDPTANLCYEQLVEDRRAGPAETAAARMDLAAWFGTLSRRNRQIAKALALGASTGEAAQQFGLSAGRISQLRGWFRQQWETFQGGMQASGNAA